VSSTLLGRRSREHAAATRARILGSAQRLIQARGVHGLTLEDIARAIGMTRGAVYGHFGTRAELLGALLCSAEAAIAERLAPLCEADKPAQLEHVLAALLDGDGAASHVSLLSALLQHKCSDACELCPLRARILERADLLRQRLAAWLPDPQRANLLIAHIWGLLSAQALHLAPGGLAHCAAPLARLYGADQAPDGLDCALKREVEACHVGAALGAKRRDSTAIASICNDAAASPRPA